MEFLRTSKKAINEVVSSLHDRIIPLWDRPATAQSFVREAYRVHQMNIGKTRSNELQGLFWRRM